MIEIGRTGLKAPQIAVGCMRLANLDVKDAAEFIHTALECGFYFFDHADIYGGGKSEEIFSKALGMTPQNREKIILQSKCGIRKGFFDFSKAHILSSVDGILKRLQTDYLDILLLHRPDALVEPEEVAEAFDELNRSGKVRHFGVSNEKPMQIELLSKYLKQAICVNQLQLSITNATMISSGINVNMENASAVDRDGSVLDYCRLKDITIQPWSPLQYGFFEGVFLDNREKFGALNQVVDRMAAEKSVTPEAIAIAWLLRHPAHMQPVVGTMNSKRLKGISKALEITLTREEWYEIYRSAGNRLP